jgi:hypothetical protein
MLKTFRILDFDIWIYMEVGIGDLEFREGDYHASLAKIYVPLSLPGWQSQLKQSW